MKKLMISQGVVLRLLFFATLVCSCIVHVKGQTVKSIDEVKSILKNKDEQNFNKLFFNTVTTLIVNGQERTKQGEGAIKVVDLDLTNAKIIIDKVKDSQWELGKVELVIIRNLTPTNVQSIKVDLLGQLPSLKYVYLILEKNDFGNWLNQLSGEPDNAWHYVYTKRMDAE